jgi:hypothetical protein
VKCGDIKVFILTFKFQKQRSLRLMGVPDGEAEGAVAPPPPSLLGKQSQSGNIRFTVGQYWQYYYKN